jgi:signal transduction histidine kinase
MRIGPWLLRAANLAALLAGAWLYSRGRASNPAAPAAAAVVLLGLQGALVFTGKPEDEKGRRWAESACAALDLLFVVWAIHWIGAWRLGLETAAVAPAVLLGALWGPGAGALAGGLPVVLSAVLGNAAGRPFQPVDLLGVALSALPAAASGFAAGSGAGPSAGGRSLARLRAAQFGEYLSFVMFQLRDYVITLNSIAEALALSLPKDDPKLMDRVERLRKTVQELSGKLGRLLGDKHALTSYQATQAPLDVPELVRRCAEEARRQFAPEVAVDVHVEGTVPPAKSDKKVVEHSVLAVLQNALEACHLKGGGRVTVLVRAVDGHADVEVTDDGGGMSEQQLATAFEPIVSARPGGAGMGLGLSMTRRFLERIGGGIRLKSKGGFTAVLLQIPLDRALPNIRNEESTWAGRRAGAA